MTHHIIAPGENIAAHSLLSPVVPVHQPKTFKRPRRTAPVDWRGTDYTSVLFLSCIIEELKRDMEMFSEFFEVVM